MYAKHCTSIMKRKAFWACKLTLVFIALELLLRV